MKILIDDANIESIKELYAVYPVDGVTTNPTILKKAGRPPYEVLKEIRAFIGYNDLHVQVVGDTPDIMLQEAARIHKELGSYTFIKVPTTPEGLQVMRAIKNAGGRVTATAIYTPMQLFWAAKAGADYAAPYVNRIDNLSGNGIASVQTMQDILENHGFMTKILGASFKNVQQVQALAAYGCAAATVSPDVLHQMLKNDSVTLAVQAFVDDFHSLAGEGRSMADI
ncbi:fructose-6-phosphate aldolase [Selenomonas sp. TAMA-11512]|uniref:transaldolase family protein n=1 Tax=Selenomonas sp. TAMA-11512 TaxID=3095337 RepID=UPI00308ABB8A|nr:fructose-6-phosphate aldolase [Selenomonas sp. TAMA-11512]